MFYIDWGIKIVLSYVFWPPCYIGTIKFEVDPILGGDDIIISANIKDRSKVKAEMESRGQVK